MNEDELHVLRITGSRCCISCHHICKMKYSFIVLYQVACFRVFKKAVFLSWRNTPGFLQSLSQQHKLGGECCYYAFNGKVKNWLNICCRVVLCLKDYHCLPSSCNIVHGIYSPKFLCFYDQYCLCPVNL